MFSLPILVLFLDTTPLIEALLPQNEAESFYGLANVAANLVTVDNTDAVIISDFELKQQVSSDFFRELCCGPRNTKLMFLVDVEWDYSF